MRTAQTRFLSSTRNLFVCWTHFPNNCAYLFHDIATVASFSTGAGSCCLRVEPAVGGSHYQFWRVVVAVAPFGRQRHAGRRQRHNENWQYVPPKRPCSCRLGKRYYLDVVGGSLGFRFVAFYCGLEAPYGGTVTTAAPLLVGSIKYWPRRVSHRSSVAPIATITTSSMRRAGGGSINSPREGVKVDVTVVLQKQLGSSMGGITRPPRSTPTARFVVDFDSVVYRVRRLCFLFPSAARNHFAHYCRVWVRRQHTMKLPVVWSV
jgi:hypothetical protein